MLADPAGVTPAHFPRGASTPYRGKHSRVSYRDESFLGVPADLTGVTSSVPCMDGSREFCRDAKKPYKSDPSSVSYGGESSLGLPADPVGPIPAEIPHERQQGSGTSDGALSLIHI